MAGVGVGVVVLETLPAWTLTSWNMKVGSFVVEVLKIETKPNTREEGCELDWV